MLALILIILIAYTLVLKKVLLKKSESQYFYYREIPTNDTPSYVGKIIKGHTDGNDIISTILDLSYRGYIKIETEQINQKTKRVLYLQRNSQSLELQEHEIFLINQIFKNSNRIIFDDYIESSKFKQDFKAFDKMLDRRIERKSIYRNSLLKNVNKIILITSFLIFGITIFYSISAPIIRYVMPVDMKNKTIINIIIGGVLYVFVAYKYISYINRSANAQENINLNIAYIVLSVILGCIIAFNGFEKILSTLYLEYSWYKIIINFILSVIMLLYMFNIIKHTEKEEYLYYFFIVVSIISIIINLNLAMGISIIFFATYIFFKSPKNTNLKQEDFIYKWVAFKKYLEEYSLLSEQEENAIIIWEKYLIYAISLGINKKIIKKYSKLSRTILIDEQYIKRFYIEYLE